MGPLRRLAFAALVAFSSTVASASVDSLRIYARYVMPNTGGPRMDETLLVGFRFLPGFSTEAGIRLGQRDWASSYFQYKLEVTSDPFFEVFRAFGRLSSEAARTPASREQTNWLAGIQARVPVAGAWSLFGGAGAAYVAEDARASAVPTLGGERQSLVPLFRVGAEWEAWERGSVALSFGDYDVFSPYPASQPFFQIDGSQDFRAFKVFAYVRYRFDGNPGNFYQLYSALGVAFHG